LDTAEPVVWQLSQSFPKFACAAVRAPTTTFSLPISPMAPSTNTMTTTALMIAAISSLFRGCGTT
jgi:hypothetical protein